MIWGYQHILGHMKICCSSKSLVPKFIDSSYKQYIILEHPNVLTQKFYTNRLDIVKKSLWILSVFLVWFFGLKLCWYIPIAYYPPPKIDHSFPIRTLSKKNSSNLSLLQSYWNMFTPLQYVLIFSMIKLFPFNQSDNGII